MITTIYFYFQNKDIQYVWSVLKYDVYAIMIESCAAGNFRVKPKSQKRLRNWREMREDRLFDFVIGSLSEAA